MGCIYVILLMYVSVYITNNTKPVYLHKESRSEVIKPLNPSSVVMTGYCLP
jgi:hypothetical protein